MAYLNKLPISGTTDFSIIYTDWKEDKVQIEIIDLRDSSEWIGEILLNDLQSAAGELEIPCEKFLEECKRALCTNDGLENFKYTFEDTSFVVRKVLKFTETYFIVPLVEHHGLSKKLMLESTSLIETARKELDTKMIDHQTLNMEFKMLILSYEKIVAEKDRIEKELLKKCSILLNSKKAKIAELQELLSERRQLSENLRADSESSKSSQDKTTDVVDDESTQELPLAPVHSKRLKLLPKRKNLTSVSIIKDQVKPTEQEPCEENNELGPESEKSLNSENIFDAM